MHSVFFPLFNKETSWKLESALTRVSIGQDSVESAESYRFVSGLGRFGRVSAESPRVTLFCTILGDSCRSIGMARAVPDTTRPSRNRLGRDFELWLLCTKLCMSVDRALFWLHMNCVLAPFGLRSLHYLFRWVKKTLPSSFYLLSPYTTILSTSLFNCRQACCITRYLICLYNKISKSRIQFWVQIWILIDFIFLYFEFRLLR